MPIYNVDQYISECLESILTQPLSDFELLILDDCSTDNSVQTVSKFALNDERVTLIRNSENIGIIASRNKLMKLAKGQYSAIMDGDDICHPQRFFKQIEYLDNNPEITILGSSYSTFGDTERVINVPSDPSSIEGNLIFANVVCNPSVVYRTAIFQEQGCEFNDEFKGAADFELWSRLSQTLKIANLPEHLLKYRVHASQESTANRERQTKAHLRVVRQNLSRFDIAGLDIEKFEPMIWPRKLELEQLEELGTVVKRVHNHFSATTLAFRFSAIAFLEARYKTLCAMQGVIGIWEYIKHFGFVNFFKGRRLGLSFMASCMKQQKVCRT